MDQVRAQNVQGFDEQPSGESPLLPGISQSKFNPLGAIHPLTFVHDLIWWLLIGSRQVAEIIGQLPNAGCPRSIASLRRGHIHRLILWM